MVYAASLQHGSVTSTGMYLMLGSQELSHQSDLPITFVHTPMPVVALPETKDFWDGFDRQYYSAHPGLHSLEGRIMWELPYWAHELAGVRSEEHTSELQSQSNL